jgi:HlyD family secretion protein
MKTRKILLLASAIAVTACGDPAPKPLQGYVEGEYVRVAAPFAGTLVKLETQRGQRIEPGAPLFALEAENEDAARREAEERVRRAEAQVDDLKKGRRATEIEAVRAQLAQSQAVSAQAERELARQQELAAKGFVSQQRVDDARAERDRARARVAELTADLETARSGARPDEIRGAEAEAAAARQALKQADWKLRQKTVAASVSGTVVDTLFVNGEWVPAGAPVVSMLPPGNVKVRFFIPEASLGAVKVGQKVSLACDGCSAPIPASITYIAPQAEYTPPVIYSKDSRGKLVFLAEARPQAADAMKLHPGQPIDVALQ